MECRLSGLASVRINTTTPTDSSTPPLRSVAASLGSLARSRAQVAPLDPFEPSDASALLRSAGTAFAPSE
jgi:hypothetical protein